MSSESKQPLGALLPLNPAYPKIAIFTQETFVGRRKDCEARIIDQSLTLSGRHALITNTSDSEEFFIQDFSTNGTWLNNKRLERGKPVPLSNGDELSFLPPEHQTVSVTGSGIVYVFHNLLLQSSERVIVEMGEQGIQQQHEFIKILGQGTFGKVWLSFDKEKKRHCASKVMCKRKYSRLKGSLASIQEEVDILSRLVHPQICSIYDSYETPNFFILMLELVSGGDLSDLILSHENGMPDTLAKQCFSQILEALKYLHSKGIAHRDLKPENVLVASKSRSVPLLKLTDFGLSRLVGDANLMRTVCGTMFYLAPEIIQHGLATTDESGYDNKVDLWSAGVILYQLLTGQLPMRTSTGAPPVHSQILEVLHPEFVLPVPTQASVAAGELLRKLLTGPQNRWQAAEALQCIWLSPSFQLQRGPSWTQTKAKVARKATLELECPKVFHLNAPMAIIGTTLEKALDNINELSLRPFKRTK